MQTLINTTMNYSLLIITTLLPFFLLLFVFLEQLSYLKKKRTLPGPTFLLPFLGNAVSLVRHPTRFWDHQSSLASSSGISANYVAGKFILFIRDTSLSLKVFTNVRPDAFGLIGSPFGKKLFGEHNLIYLTGNQHKDLRRSMGPIFTPNALATYTKIQQKIIIKHLSSWARLASRANYAIELRSLVRDMNLETSHTVFVGPYLAPEDMERFRDDYNLFNEGVMQLPFDLPGTPFRKARLAVARLVETLTGCVKRSRAEMEARVPHAPTCLVDFWMHEMVKERDASGAEVIDDKEMGAHLFDFLFAAQDASTSSLLWAVALLDSHPDVLARVREEVAGIWSSDELITADQLVSMKYTYAVAREVVRYRAPAALVPHVTHVDFPLTETYTVPKGTIVFPSAFEACFQGFSEPNRFDPERFSEERQEDRVFKRNYLAFGAGPHQCVGQRYALSHLVLFIAMFATLMDFKRDKTDGCDEIKYIPTMCPKDDCRVFLSLRSSRLSK